MRAWTGSPSPEPQGERFVVKRAGKRYATPLLVALVAIEIV